MILKMALILPNTNLVINRDAKMGSIKDFFELIYELLIIHLSVAVFDKINSKVIWKNQKFPAGVARPISR